MCVYLFRTWSEPTLLVLDKRVLVSYEVTLACMHDTTDNVINLTQSAAGYVLIEPSCTLYVIGHFIES